MNKTGPLPTSINDYTCNHCDALKEGIGGPPAELCDCHVPPIQGEDPPVKEWRLVFTAVPEIRTEHASTVLHVIDHNRKKMNEIYEEDAETGSQAQCDIANMTHAVEHAESTEDYDDYYGMDA